MKNADSAPHHLNGSSVWRRLLALAVLALFAYLIWAATTGVHDRQVDRVADWLARNFHALLDWLTGLWRSLTG